MKIPIFCALILLVSCTKNTKIHHPVGGFLEENSLEISKNRAKNLNLLERNQIQEWIKEQDVKFYPTGLNYWTDIPNVEQRVRKEDGDLVSYAYDMYDFNQEKLYQQPQQKKNAALGKFNELKAVEDALRYMEKGEQATLLVPSVLAFGTYGDDEKIPNDMPLIIKLRIL